MFSLMLLISVHVIHQLSTLSRSVFIEFLKYSMLFTTVTVNFASVSFYIEFLKYSVNSKYSPRCVKFNEQRLRTFGFIECVTRKL